MTTWEEAGFPLENQFANRARDLFMHKIRMIWLKNPSYFDQLASYGLISQKDKEALEGCWLYYFSPQRLMEISEMVWF